MYFNKTTLCLIGASLFTVGISTLIRRNKRFAVFQSIILSVHTISSSMNFASVLPLPLFVYLNATVYIQLLSLLSPSLKSRFWRILISYPQSYYFSCTFLWFLCTPISKYAPTTIYIPLTLCFLGFLQTIRFQSETVDLDLVSPTPTNKLIPLKVGINPQKTPTRTLRVCQITDPHLGPFMSADRLRYVCETIVKWDPDLVLLTGDYITMESYFAGEELARGFEPLKQLRGKTFACLGNHDYESLDVVEYALKKANIQLLKDEEAIVNTIVGPVQIVGTEFSFSKAKEHIEKVYSKFPRKENHMRLFLVHNPAEFKHFPDKEVDLVFSGHTHGGQLGLFSLGIHLTVYKMVTKSPDYGFWGMGRNRLYVHRGTGQYGFPIRIGVPNELSMLNIHC